MWNFIKAIIGLFIIYILCMNFHKAVAIGNTLFDKAYQLVVTKPEKVDSININ